MRWILIRVSGETFPSSLDTPLYLLYGHICSFRDHGANFFSDVLGAGNGWAKSILMHEGARNTFQAFFNRPDTFALGVCNGCQMFSRLRELIPGTQHWPQFGMCISVILRWSV